MRSNFCAYDAASLKNTDYVFFLNVSVDAFKLLHSYVSFTKIGLKLGTQLHEGSLALNFLDKVRVKCFSFILEWGAISFE